MNTNISKSLSQIHLSGDTIKLIAVISMIIDHSGYCLLRYYMNLHYMDILPQTYTRLNNVYEVMRGIGRIAFPIFCFFLVEGFFRTHNIKKHILRLALFAIISEVPFNLAHFRVPFDWSHQNVMFELLLGFIMLILLQYIENIIGLSLKVKWLCIMCTVAAFVEIACYCKADYNAKGIILIAVLYLLRSTGAFSLLAGAATISIEKYAPISFILLYFYDSKTKPKLKYFFYLFYPIHLFVIYLLGFLLFQ